MNIILEGNECTYKTTFAQRIVEDHGLVFAKGSSFASAKGTPEELFEDYKKIFKADSTVFDRSFYSNIVYATLYPQFTILSWNQVRELESMLKDTTVVWCRASERTIKERLAIRGDDHVHESMVGAINTHYNIVMPMTKLTLIVLDTDNKTSDECYEILRKGMNWND